MKTLQIEIRKRQGNIKERGTEALEITIEEGAGYIQDNLEDAVTRTGLARAEQGGFPGRHKSGNMISDVSHEIRNKRSKRVWGVFGWWAENFERYFRDQDQGEGDIPAARALPQAEVVARERFRQRMRDIVS